MNESTSRQSALCVAALAFGVSTPVTYALERLVEWARGEHGDPRLILRTLHTTYYWRAVLAFWWGGVVAILVYAWLVSRGDPERMARKLVIVSWLVLPVFLFVTWRFP